jgi:hypothetical protein
MPHLQLPHLWRLPGNAQGFFTRLRHHVQYRMNAMSGCLQRAFAQRLTYRLSLYRRVVSGSKPGP